MRTIFIIAITLFIFSCKKAAYEKKLSGTWEYEHFSGYPFTQPVLPPGNGNVIVLGSNGSFQRMKHDTLLFKGTYKLILQKDCDGPKKWLFTTDDASFGSDRYVSVDENKLYFNTPACYQDGGTTVYNRIAEE